MQDTSLRVPHIGSGVVRNVKIFTRANGDSAIGGNMLVRVPHRTKTEKIRVEWNGWSSRKQRSCIRIVPVSMPYLPIFTG